tara:strand:+ start:837 stop:977 length:141 start_codon:yes stop_codon:yes gene_type:complete
MGSVDLSFVQEKSKKNDKQIIKMYLILYFMFKFMAEKLNKINLKKK